MFLETKLLIKLLQLAVTGKLNSLIGGELRRLACLLAVLITWSRENPLCLHVLGSVLITVIGVV